MGHSASSRFPSPLIEPDLRISRTRLCAWKGEKQFPSITATSASGYKQTLAGQKTTSALHPGADLPGGLPLKVKLTSVAESCLASIARGTPGRVRARSVASRRSWKDTINHRSPVNGFRHPSLLLLKIEAGRCPGIECDGHDNRNVKDEAATRHIHLGNLG